MSRTSDSIFRPFVPSDAERSDRSAGDRARHRLKLRESIRDNIADIIAEESIIGKDRGKIIKVPIRGIKEFRFVYGENTPGVGQGNGESQQGQVVGKIPGHGGRAPEGVCGQAETLLHRVTLLRAGASQCGGGVGHQPFAEESDGLDVILAPQMPVDHAKFCFEGSDVLVGPGVGAGEVGVLFRELVHHEGERGGVGRELRPGGERDARESGRDLSGVHRSCEQQGLGQSRKPGRQALQVAGFCRGRRRGRSGLRTRSGSRTRSAGGRGLSPGQAAPAHMGACSCGR
mgnify:CR=1 FL=1